MCHRLVGWLLVLKPLALGIWMPSTDLGAQEIGACVHQPGKIQEGSVKGVPTSPEGCRAPQTHLGPQEPAGRAGSGTGSGRCCTTAAPEGHRALGALSLGKRDGKGDTAAPTLVAETPLGPTCSSGGAKGAGWPMAGWRCAGTRA